MTTSPETYDLSDPRTSHCSIDVVGEFAYDRATRKLIRDLNAPEREGVFFTASIVPEPDNPYSEHGHALSVRWNNQVIGYFSESDAGEYQQIRRITASGATATTRARLWYFVGDDGKNRVYLSLNIRGPETLVPLNDPPTEGWTLLPDGSTVQVTKEADHLDVLLDHVPPSGVGQLLVTLHEFTGGTRTTWQGIEVRLDGERIGELTKATSAKFLAAVQHFDAIGLTTVARATIKGSSLSAEVTLQAAKAFELSEEDLEPVVSPLPRLVPFAEDATRYDVPDAYRPTTGERITARAQQKVREVLTPEETPVETAPVTMDEPTPAPAPVPAPAPPTHEVRTTPPVNPYAVPRTPEPQQPFPAAAAASSPRYAPRTVPQHMPQKSRSTVGAAVTGTVATLEHIHTRRPGLISTVLLWTGAVFGVIAVLAGFSSFGASVTYATGTVLIGIAVALACGWPLSRRRVDRKAVTDWEEEIRRSAELSSLLTPEDAAVAAGLTQAPRPAPSPRQWKKVGTVAAVIGVVGIILVSAGTAEYQESTGTVPGSSTISGTGN